MDADPRGRALRALSHFLISESPLSDTLARISEITVDTLTGAEYAGMTLVDEDGRPTTAVFTDERSPEIDSAQYVAGHGPCLTAWRTGEVVAIDDTTAADAPYPEFRAAARAHGICCTLSLPLRAGEASLGALNLYGRSVGGFDAGEREVAEELAILAGVLLANSSAYWGAHALTRQLNDALVTRPVIDQAKGILMAQDPGLDADGAFELLRLASQRENVKLRDIAMRVVARRT